MDGDIETAIYTLIYSFLTKRSHAKAAQAVKKAAKDIISLDDIDTEPQLYTILEEWRKFHAKTDIVPEAPSTPDSDSEPSSSRSSRASDSSSGGSTLSRRKKLPRAKRTSGSSSNSSASDSDSTTQKQKPSKIAKSPEVKAVDRATKSSSSDSSSSSSDSKSSRSSSSSSDSDGSQSDDESSDLDTKANNELKAKIKSRKKGKFERDSSRTLTSGNNSDASQAELVVKMDAESAGKEKDMISKKLPPKKQENETDDSASGSESESESDSTPAHASASTPSATSSGSGSDESSTSIKIEKEKEPKKRKARDQSSSDSDSDSDSEMDEDPPVNNKPGIGLHKDTSHNAEAQVTKKRRTSESGAAISTAITMKDGAESTGHGNGNNGKTPRKPKKVNTPFRRHDPDKVPVDVIRDNRYEAKAASTNDYGQRAHKDLIVTRGAGFRKEKNKKKRGSYRGGEITLESHSFKFT